MVQLKGEATTVVGRAYAHGVEAGAAHFAHEIEVLLANGDIHAIHKACARVTQRQPPGGLAS